MGKRLKYEVVDGRGHPVHHSFNKRNAEQWIRQDYDGDGRLRIRKKRIKKDERSMEFVLSNRELRL